MDAIDGLSQALALAVEAAGVSVVRVEARRGAPGSGIIWSQDGAVVTAEHALERDDDLHVGFADGRVAGAAVVGRDPTTDVALLRVEATGSTPPTWADLGATRTGHLALALFRPGRTLRAHLGIVSAFGEAWRTPAGGEVDRYIQADVDITWGLSGGALVNASGQVLGMTTAGLLRRSALAVPRATLERVTAALLIHGRIRRGYLGIGGHPVRLPAQVRDQLGRRHGLIVVAVEPGSPAEQSGLMLGDVIVAIDDAPVRHHEDVAARLGPDAVGKGVTVRILRGGALRDLSVNVGERRS